MLGKVGADIIKRRAMMQYAPETKHPGSKPGYRHRASRPVKGNTWRAMTRSLRCYPGWRKRATSLARDLSQAR